MTSALIVVDMLNSYEHEDADEGARPDLVEPVLPPDSADFVLKERNMSAEITSCAEVRLNAGS